MTQEEKQLLLKDICERLHYGVKLGFENSDLILVPKEFNIYTMQLFTNQIYPKSDSMVIRHGYDVWNYRPYLRPMSSMTEKEKEELFQLMGGGTDVKRIDFYISHHFDYRGLIEKGLALEAKEGMYKTE